MTRKKCIYCDTLYPEDSEQCPLCGGAAYDLVDVPEDDQIVETPRADSEPDRENEKSNRRTVRAETAAVPVAKKPEKKSRKEPDPAEEADDENIDESESPASSVPKWMTGLICAVLVAALVVGLAFTAYTLGFFDRNDTTQEDDQSLTLPYDDSQDDETTDDQQTDDSQVDTTTPDETDTKDNTDDNDSSDSNTSDSKEEETTTDPAASEQTPDENKETETQPEETETVKKPCTGIKLNLTDVSLFSKGESFTLKATVSPSDCDEEVVWTSSDESYLKIDETGKATAVNGKGGGSVMATATCGSYSAECIVRLQFAETEDSSSAEGTGNYSLNLTDFTMSRKGEEVEVEVNGFNQLTDSVVWSIGDSSVATLNTLTNTAFVTAVSTGTTYLYATVNGTIKLTCIVRCSANVSGAATAETGG